MIYKTIIGRSKEDVEKHGIKAAGYIGKHIVGSGEEAHTTVKVYLDLLRPHIILVTGKRGTGKCIKSDENIVLCDGSIFKAEDLFNLLAPSKISDEELVQVSDKNFYVASISENLKNNHFLITHCYRKKVNERLLVIKTRSGRKISVTQDHPLLILDETPKWKKAIELKIGDYVAVPRKLRIKCKKIKLRIPNGFKKAKFFSLHPRKMKFLEWIAKSKIIEKDDAIKKLGHKADCLALLNFFKKRRFINIRSGRVSITKTGISFLEGIKTNEHYFINPYGYPVKIPQYVDEKLSEFFGYLISEGSETGNVIKMTNLNPEIKKRFLNLFSQLFGVIPHTNYKDVVIESINLRRLFEGWGYPFGSNSFEKEIPWFILKSPDKIVSRFLRAFCDGEAYVSKKNYRIEITTSSKKLFEQLAYLFLRLDIFPILNEKNVRKNGATKRYYVISIFGKSNLKKFWEKINFYHKSKRKKLKLLLKKQSRTFTRFDVIPTIGKILKYTRQLLKLKQTDLGIKQVIKAFEDNKRNLTRTRLSEILKIFKIRFNIVKKKLLPEEKNIVRQNIKLLERLSTSDVFWDKIEKIEEVEYSDYVYDFTVDKAHSFIGGLGGIVCHNSYVAGVIAEEIALLPEEFRKNLSVIMIDTMGIFWSLKKPNEQQKSLLKEWNIEPRGFENVKVFVPYSQLEDFKNAGIPVDEGISILPYDFSAEEWRLAFNLKRTEPAGIALEKVINQLLESGQKFSIDDIITKVRDDKETSQEVKSALENMLTVAKQWGVFGEKGIDIDDIVQPGQISVVDVSRLRATEAWSVRNFLVAIIARKIYEYRVLARKEEEIAKLEGVKIEKKYPMVWLVADEAHNWAPSDFETVSSMPFLTIAKQGREPGVSLVVITQMPNKIHQDILSQCDLVISHRLTSKDDLQALHAVYQTYMAEEIEKMINKLPRWPGAALILDDNLEKIFTVCVRPRLSWHAGGTAAVV